MSRTIYRMAFYVDLPADDDREAMLEAAGQAEAIGTEEYVIWTPQGVILADERYPRERAKLNVETM